MSERLTLDQAYNESLAYRPYLDGHQAYPDLNDTSASLSRSRGLLQVIQNASELDYLTELAADQTYDGGGYEEILDEVVYNAPYLDPEKSIELFNEIFDDLERFSALAGTVAIGGLQALTHVDEQASIALWRKAYINGDDSLGNLLDCTLDEGIDRSRSIHVGDEFKAQVLNARFSPCVTDLAKRFASERTSSSTWNAELPHRELSDRELEGMLELDEIRAEFKRSFNA